MKLFFSIILLTLSGIMFSQEDRFIGLIDNVMVQVNPFEPSVETIARLDFPPEVTGSDMTYSEDHCLFYTIIDATDQPKLVSFDFEGNYEIVGQFTSPTESIDLAEAIAYDEDNSLMYISASLNGSDFFSETLMTVDVNTAVCTYVSQMNFLNGEDADIDNMVIHDGVLYFNDGQPGNNDTDHYSLALNNLDLTSNVQHYLRVPYDASSDVIYFEGSLYYPTLDRRLFTHDVVGLQESSLGFTHSNTEYDGIRMRGLEYIEDWTELDLSGFVINNPVCIGSAEIIGLNIGAFDVEWSTGETGPFIEIDQPGTYTASIFFEGCFIFETETLTVLPEYEFALEFEECEATPVVVNGETYNETGLYFQNYFTEDGCDSIYSINVIMNESITRDESYSFCENSSLDIYGMTITEAGSFTIELGGIECDTIVNIVVTQNLINAEFLEYGICPNEEIEINGSIYNEEGIFSQVLLNEEGCDSLIDINVILLEDRDAELKLSKCEGFTVSVNDIDYEEDGLYIQELMADNGCDSTLHILIESSGIYIPNVFDPGQPDNGTFYPFVTCDINFHECYIFDRWGNRVYYSESLSDSWNGRANGVKCEVGVYTYLMKFGVTDVDEIIRTGDVLLLR